MKKSSLMKTKGGRINFFYIDRIRNEEIHLKIEMNLLMKR